MTSDMDDEPEDPGQRQAQQAYGEGDTPFLPREREPLLERAVPVSRQLARYRGDTARRDTLAGMTVAALAIPSAMAALIALPTGGFFVVAPARMQNR